MFLAGVMFLVWIGLIYMWCWLLFFLLFRSANAPFPSSNRGIGICLTVASIKLVLIMTQVNQVWLNLVLGMVFFVGAYMFVQGRKSAS